MSEKIIKMINNEEWENPLLFEDLERLALYLFLHWKFVNNSAEAKELATYAAEDVLMRSYLGDKVYAPIRFIYARRMYYLKEVKKLNGEVVKRIPKTYDAEIATFRISAGGSLDLSLDFQRFQIRDFLESLDVLIYNKLKQLCRYNEDSYEFKHIYLSLILSIAHNKLVYVFIPDNIKNYCILMHNQIKDYIRSELLGMTDTGEINDKDLITIRNITKSCVCEDNKDELNRHFLE